MQPPSNAKRRPPAPREPLATLAEIAPRLGTTTGSLRSLMSHYPINRPTPVFSRSSTGLRYYRPSEVTHWFHALKEKRA